MEEKKKRPIESEQPKEMRQKTLGVWGFWDFWVVKTGTKTKFRPKKLLMKKLVIIGYKQFSIFTND